MRRLGLILKLLALTALFLALIAPEWPAFGDEAHRLDALIGQRRFDFLVWEAQALSEKAEAALANGQASLDDETRKEFVLDYLELVGKTKRLTAEIERFYVDPDVVDPDQASAELQMELAEKRAELEEIRPLAEAILQEQTAVILADEEFSLLNQAWPPVMMHMTPLPSILIVSPRDRIDRLYGIPLVEGLTAAEKEALETAVFEELNLSALVVPIGGLGIYPSMIQETSNTNWLATVIAHEWAHHWLTLRPLGVYYLESTQLRTMNETVASILGDEAGAKMIERFYPELVPDPPPTSPPIAPEPDPDAPPPFDFRAEMAITRMGADELLAEGKIEEAEAYMEARRRVFVENGYNVRKINQAYFAFYGAYADTPGATGGDPIGPMLLEMRENSPSLRAFMDAVAPITSYDEFEAVYERLTANSD